MEAIISIVAKYWLEFILAGLGACLLAKFKKFKNTYILGQEQQIKEKVHDPIMKEVDEKIKKVEASMDAMEKAAEVRKEMYFEHEQKIYVKIDEIVLNIAKQFEALEKSGQERGEEARKRDELTLNALLYLQKKDFLRSCEELLEPDHYITFEEYGQITEDHETYNKLGGNHRGDNLFNAVQAKYRRQTQQGDYQDDDEK